MKRTTRKSARCFLANLGAPVFLLLMLVTLVDPASASGGLLFFRATENGEAYSQSPQKYDQVILRPGSRRKMVYVERTPILRIELKEVETVVIEKKAVYTDTQRALEEALGLGRGPREKGNDKGIAGYYYMATFSLTKEGSKTFIDFADKHDQELFGVRLHTHRLGVVRLLGPFESNTFSAELAEKDIDRLRTIFSSIEDKVTWK